jgi:ribosome maturation factor RimP
MEIIGTRGRKSPLFVSMIKKELIEQLALERIEEIGKDLFIVDIRISSSNQIHVEIDSAEGNIAIDDCIRVSRNIEHNLDREEQDFELQVSSPGIDKPFKVKQQYFKNIGRQVKVTLNSGDILEGLLKAADETLIVIETTRKERLEGRKKKETIVEEHPIQYDKIKEIKIIITFK